MCVCGGRGLEGEVCVCMCVCVCEVYHVLYSGKISLVHYFAKLPSNPSKDIFVVFNFMPVLW